MANFNCVCEDDWPQETLANLRRRLMVRLGFAAQADNPPPGMTDLLNDFLQDAQEQLYRRYDVLRTERFFRWTMTPGERFYDIRSNDEIDGEDPGHCDVTLDPRKVTWVGVSDLNGVWYPLIEGIPPEAYTMIDAAPGWPTRYEIRQCIEVWPAPDEAYTLRIKGHFGLQPFTEDEDTTTIDPHAVFLFALGLGKRHYGKRDAEDAFRQVASYIGGLVAGSHHTARYVPAPRRPLEALTPPRMVSFDA